jgi:hypothetical protein
MAVFRQATGAYAPFRIRFYWAFYASEPQTAVMEASTGTYAPCSILGIEVTASRPSSTPPNHPSRQTFPRGELDVLTPLPIGDSDAV